MSPLHKDLHATYDFHGKEVKVVAKEYIQRKKTVLVADPMEQNIFIWFPQENRKTKYLHQTGRNKIHQRNFGNVQQSY
jgi:hypothetical protein